MQFRTAALEAKVEVRWPQLASSWIRCLEDSLGCFNVLRPKICIANSSRARASRQVDRALLKHFLGSGAGPERESAGSTPEDRHLILRLSKLSMLETLFQREPADSPQASQKNGLDIVTSYGL